MYIVCIKTNRHVKILKLFNKISVMTLLYEHFLQRAHRDLFKNITCIDLDGVFHVSIDYKRLLMWTFCFHCFVCDLHIFSSISNLWCSTDDVNFSVRKKQYVSVWILLFSCIVGFVIPRDNVRTSCSYLKSRWYNWIQRHYSICDSYLLTIFPW